MSVHNSENSNDDVADNVTLISKMDISDPLHLHPNDTTALTVVSIKLKGTENYQVWSCAMLLALKGKNKIGFINGSCKRSNTDEVFGKQWDRNGSSIADYYHKLNALWKQYDAMIELPKCVCNASEGFKKHNQLLKLMQLGLDDSYMKIRSSILTREVLPDMRSTYATISSEESHRVVVDKELDNVFDISHRKIKVGHPNRIEAYIFKLRNLRLSNGLTLYDVMVIPEYCVTLISVHKLVKENKVIVAFDENRCYFLNQDLNLKNVLGIGDQCKGLYYYNGQGIRSNNSTLRYQCLLSQHDWHYRLGHPADLVLNVIKDSLPIDKKDNTGPYKVTSSEGFRLYSLDKHQFIFSRDVKFFENIFPFKDSEIPNNDERVANDLNNGKSDSSSSSMPGRNTNTSDFPVDSKNDADSSDNLVATQNEEVATLDENDFNKGNLDQNPSSSQGVQNVRRSSRQRVFPRNYNDFVVESKVKYRLEKYTNAMNQEIDALLRNDTWELVELHEGRKAIGSKWIYKIKFRSIGEIDRYKARLVAQGFGKKEGIDYEEIFSPIVKMVSVRCLLNIVVSMSWPVFQLDMNNAFLYDDLEEVVYMKPPEGYFPSDNKVCRLKKYVYDLKLAPRQWNAKLNSTLIENGLSQSKSDYSLYTKSDKEVFLALLVYVNDIIILGNSSSEIEKFKVYLKSKFMIKDLEKLKYFLKIVVIDIDKGICLNQRKYVLDLLSKLMGKLIYLTNTRPDISYVVHCLSQFMHSPLSSHLKIAFKILRYPKSCPGLGIHIARTPGMFLKAYSDADWAKCTVTRKSVTGYCVFLNNSPVSWKSKKQNTLSKSSTEAEYRALASVTSEVIWILKILKDLQIEKLLPVSLHYDSNLAIKIDVNIVFHERTKHLEIDLHFVRENILKGVVKTVKVDTANQIADILTKGLDTVQHLELVKMLGMYDVYQFKLVRRCEELAIGTKRNGHAREFRLVIQEAPLPTYSLGESGRLSSSRALHMFRNWFTCGTNDTHEKAVVVINKRKGVRTSTVSSVSEKTREENNMGPTYKEQKFRGFEKSYDGKSGSKKSKNESRNVEAIQSREAS
ncbi:ribonuclease H-like domain-containing protein [Tanacetum coccineum]